MSAKQLQQHVAILGWLHIALGIVFLAFGAMGFMMMVGIGLLTGEADGFVIMSMMGIFASFMMLLVALPAIIVGLGLLKHKNWGRMLAIVLAIFNLMNVPLGTAMAVYTFYVLFQNDANDFFAPAKAY